MPAGGDPFYLDLGRRIQRLRRQRELTQEQLGARLIPQVTRASIANIESGKQRVLAHTLAQIAQALDVTADDLVRDRSVVLDAEVKQQLGAELQDRLRLSPESLSKLSQKLGLEPTKGMNAATTENREGKKSGREPD